MTTPFVTRRGEQGSFAPEGAVFTAPENVASFQFKPLSPASAGEFLFPNAQMSSPPARRCSSTPKITCLSSHPKVVHSPGTSMIAEAKESSAEESQSGSETEPERMVLSEIEVSASPDMRARSKPRRGAVKKISPLAAVPKPEEGNYDSDKENVEPQVPVSENMMQKPIAADAEDALRQRLQLYQLRNQPFLPRPPEWLCRTNPMLNPHKKPRLSAAASSLLAALSTK